MSHKQLVQEQRYQIYTLKKAGVKWTIGGRPRLSKINA